MPKSFVFNMGYDTSHVFSVLSKEGLDHGSSVILTVPRNRDERQENAIEDIRNYLASLDIKVSLETFAVGESLNSDLIEFNRLLSDLDSVVVSLSGGPRDSLIPLTISATVQQSNMLKTYFRSDISSELETLDLPHLQSEDLSKSDEKLLEEIQNRESPQSIVENVEMSESSVYRKLSDLDERDLIDKEKMELTDTGRFAFQL